ncbi:MAG: hypothetical protein ABSB63_02730 [Spirochaetia bacterium]
MSDIVPRSVLTKQGVKGVGAVAGGVVLLALAGGGLFGIVVGAVLALGGLALSGSRSDRTAGIVTAVVGAATLLTGIFGGPLAWLMRAAGFVFLGGGIYLLVKFFRGLRSRS